MVRRAGEEVLQRAADLLRQAVDERREQRALVVVGQVAGELLRSASSDEKPYWREISWVSCEPPKAWSRSYSISSSRSTLQAGRVGADLEQRDQRILALRWAGLR